MTTSACHRLAKLEGALPPREAVLAWLVEAQQLPSVLDHARSIALLPVEAAPLSVIGARVDAAVRASMKGQPRDDIWDAVRRSVGDAAFLFALVLQVNVQALEMAKLEGLRATAVFFWMGTLLGGPRAADLPSADAKVYVRELADAWTTWRSVVDRLDVDLRIENEARATLQRRYFDGHDLFLADVVVAWADHVDLVERLVNLADLLASPAKPRARRRAASGTETSRPIAERVALRVAQLADDARVRAYEIVGERERGVAIMERRLLAD